MKKSDAWLLAIPVCTIFVMLENHYIRDTVGALEKQMETDLAMTPEEYSTLNSLYFMPNIIAPLFIGVFCELSGRASKLLLFTAITLAVGNIIFTIGVHTHSLALFYSGRFIAGSMYEVIDTIPIIILGPLFRANWGLMVGMMNGMLRFGTVLAFAISPLVYRAYGVEAALWISSAMGVIGIGAALAAYLADVWFEEAVLLAQDPDLSVGANDGEYEMVPYQSSSACHTPNTPLDLRRGDHGPTRKSIEYYQAMEAQISSDPLKDDAQAAMDDGFLSPVPRQPSSGNAKEGTSSCEHRGRRRSRSSSQGSADHHLTSPLHNQVSPLGALFTARNASLLRAEANAVVGASTRRRIFSADAADGAQNAEFDALFGSNPKYDLNTIGEDSEGSSEGTPLLQAAGLISSAVSMGSEQRAVGGSPGSYKGPSGYGTAAGKDGTDTVTNSLSSTNSGGDRNAMRELIPRPSERGDKTQPGMITAVWDYWQSISPFQDYGVQYYFYLLNSMCLFGAVIPFWFMGSKFLQLNYGLSVENADFLMILPEGAMVVVSPLLGLVVDWLQLSLRSKLYLMGAVCFGTGSALLMLALGYADSGSGVTISPLYTILLLSLCYACANSLTWDVVIQVVPQPDQLAPATGLSASASNLLPCLIPYLIIHVTRHHRTQGGGNDAIPGLGEAQKESNLGMLVLATTAALAGVCGLCAAQCEARTYDADILAQTGLAHSFDPALADGEGSNRSSSRGASVKSKGSRYSVGSEYEIV